MTAALVGTVAGRPPIDPRCGHVAPGGHAAQCQLWAGHQGPHAVMFVRAGDRVVRAWTDRAPAECPDLTKGYQVMPWMRGFPTPAWREEVEASPR